MKPSVEILFLEGCPNVELATERALAAVRATGSDAEVRLVRIDGDDDALARRFLGSPTVRVYGEDVDRSAIGRSDFGLQCRVYGVEGKLEGAPPVAWIELCLVGHAGAPGTIEPRLAATGTSQGEDLL